MAEIRILNGDEHKLRAILGLELARKVKLRRGDAVLVCDPAVEEEVAVGRTVFEKLLTGGHAAFAVEPGVGAKSRLDVDTWDPDEHEMVVMVGPLAGG